MLVSTSVENVLFVEDTPPLNKSLHFSEGSYFPRVITIQTATLK